MKHMQKKSPLRGKTSIHAYLVKILEEENRPMKVAELTKKVQELRDISSKNPVSTVSAVLQRSVFVTKVEKGTYSLKN